jgi:hypothetical protein
MKVGESRGFESGKRGECLAVPLREYGTTPSGIAALTYSHLSKGVYSSQAGFLHVQLLQIVEYEQGAVKPFLL